MSHIYISKDNKKEDLKSTAYSFLLVSIAGFIFLGLFLTGVLPIQVSSYTKIMLGVILGIMFLIFFAIGVRSFLQIKKAREEAEEEQEAYTEITGWFKENYSASDIDARIESETEPEQLYFSRYEIMSELLTEKCDDREEAFLDYIIEQLYGELFPD